MDKKKLENEKNKRVGLNNGTNTGVSKGGIPVAKKQQAVSSKPVNAGAVKKTVETKLETRVTSSKSLTSRSERSHRKKSNEIEIEELKEEESNDAQNDINEQAQDMVVKKTPANITFVKRDQTPPGLKIPEYSASPSHVKSFRKEEGKDEVVIEEKTVKKETHTINHLHSNGNSSKKNLLSPNKKTLAPKTIPSKSKSPINSRYTQSKKEDPIIGVKSKPIPISKPSVAKNIPKSQQKPSIQSNKNRPNIVKLDIVKAEENGEEQKKVGFVAPKIQKARSVMIEEDVKLKNEVNVLELEENKQQKQSVKPNQSVQVNLFDSMIDANPVMDTLKKIDKTSLSIMMNDTKDLKETQNAASKRKQTGKDDLFIPNLLKSVMNLDEMTFKPLTKDDEDHVNVKSILKRVASTLDVTQNQDDKDKNETLISNVCVLEIVSKADPEANVKRLLNTDPAFDAKESIRKWVNWENVSFLPQQAEKNQPKPRMSIFIGKSDNYESLRQNLEKKGEVYTDHSFPPNMKTLKGLSGDSSWE